MKMEVICSSETFEFYKIIKDYNLITAFIIITSYSFQLGHGRFVGVLMLLDDW